MRKRGSGQQCFQLRRAQPSFCDACQPAQSASVRRFRYRNPDRMWGRGCAQNLTQALDNIKKAREKADLTLQHLDTAQQVPCSLLLHSHGYITICLLSSDTQATNPCDMCGCPTTCTSLLTHEAMCTCRWRGGYGPGREQTWMHSWQRWSAWRGPSPTSNRTGARCGPT